MTASTTFDPNDPRLTAYALGELCGDELAEFERLLAESSAARDALAEIRETTAWLRSELASEPALALSAEQHQRLEQLLTVGVGAKEEPLTLTLSPQGRGEGTKPSLADASPTNTPLLASVTVARADLRHEQARHRWAVLAAAAVTAALSAAVMLWPATSPQTLSELLAMRDSPSATGQRRGYRHVNESDPNAPQDEVMSFTTLEDGLADLKPHPGVVGSGRGRNAAFGESNQPQLDGLSAASNVTRGVQDSTDPVGGTRVLGKVGGGKPVLPGLAVPSDSKGVAQREDRFKQNSGVVSGRTPRIMIGEEEGLLGTASDGRAGKPISTEAARSSSQGVDRFSKELKGIQKLPEKVRLARLEQLRAEQSKSEKGFYFESKSESRDGEKQLADHPGTEAYAAIVENPFLTPAEQPLSTFSVDVDTASYANVRRFLNQGQLPPADAVRIEELVNYFKYDDPAPIDGQPFRVVAEAAPCPWQREHYVARISLKAREIAKAQRPPTNLVFLLDVSGSMQPDNKLPLVKRAMSLLIEELGERDRVSIVTYAGDAGLKLEPTIGSDQTKIMQAIESLSAGGSTNGAAGIHLAYEQALRHFSKESANRVILCTDGDFNVGVSSDNELVTLIEDQAKSGVFLSIFGFGMGNLKDSKLEKLADKGNGHYGYIDDLNEARKNFNEELMGTLYTVAKDVKLQVEFNPLTVGAYRLIGYENRVMAAEDFNNDAKDAGEIGAGHTVTALYEIVPRGKWNPTPVVDPLKYRAVNDAGGKNASHGNDTPTEKKGEPKANVSPESADDLFTVKLRYKQPDAAASVRTVDVVVDDIAGKKVTPSRDLLWSASVASFGMQLRHSKHAGTWTMADVLETARGAKGDDTTGRRGEFVELVKSAMKLMPSPQRDPQSKKPARLE